MAERVLITGADGFIGSHLVELMVKENYHVKALVQYNSFNSWGWLDTYPEADRIEIVPGDIRDRSFCEKLCENVDLVIHLAALIAIPYSYIAPQSYIDTNVTGTLNICQASRANGVSRLIHASTSEVYGTAIYVPIDEKHPLQAQSPYSASKIGADSIAMSFYSAFGLPVTIARPFNTYGPRQSARAVIPTIITQIASGQKEVMLGDLTPTRDFNYVADTCRGLLALARCAAAIGSTVNIGSNSEISVADTLALIRRLMDSDITFAVDEERLRPPGSEVFRLWADNSKLRELTNWEPRFQLEDGLRETIAWITRPENLVRYKAHVYNR